MLFAATQAPVFHQHTCLLLASQAPVARAARSSGTRSRKQQVGCCVLCLAWAQRIVCCETCLEMTSKPRQTTTNPFLPFIVAQITPLPATFGGGHEQPLQVIIPTCCHCEEKARPRFVFRSWLASLPRDQHNAEPPLCNCSSPLSSAHPFFGGCFGDALADRAPGGQPSHTRKAPPGRTTRSEGFRVDMTWP